MYFIHSLLLLVILINHQSFAGGNFRSIFNKGGNFFRDLGEDIKGTYIDQFKNLTDAFTTTVCNLPYALQDAIKAIPKEGIPLLADAIGIYGIQLGGNSLYPLCSVILGCDNGETCVTDGEPARAIGFGKCSPSPFTHVKRFVLLPVDNPRQVLSPQPVIEPSPSVFVPIVHPPVPSPSTPAPRTFWRNIWKTADGIAGAVSDGILVAGETALNDLESGKTKVVNFGKQVFSDANQLLSNIKTVTSSVEQFVDSVFSKLIKNSEIEITAFVAHCKDDTVSCIDNVFARVGVSDYAALAVGELEALTKHIPGLPVVQNIGDGFVQAMAQMVQDMANPFIHPVQTAATIQDFIKNPASHATAIVNGVKSTCAKNAAKCAGMLIFAVFTGGKSLALGNINQASNKTGNVLQRFAEGFTGGARTGDLVVHPLNSAMSLINAVRRPAETAVLFAKAIKESCTKNAAGCAGNGGFNIATLVVPGVGEGEIAEETAAFAKLAEDATEEEPLVNPCSLLKRAPGATCGSSEAESFGVQLDKVKLDARPLGAGKFGIVFGGTLENGDRVAIKFSKIASKAEILNEQTALQKAIGQKNIVQLRGFGVDDGSVASIPAEYKNQPFIMLDLESGGDASQIVGSSQLSLDTKLQAVIEATRGVNNLHSVGLAHCDLHPGNFLIQKRLPDVTSNPDLVKLSDLGGSKPITPRLVKKDMLQLKIIIMQFFNGNVPDELEAGLALMGGFKSPQEILDNPLLAAKAKEFNI